MVADALTKSLLHALRQAWGWNTMSVYVLYVNASKQVYVQSEIVYLSYSIDFKSKSVAKWRLQRHELVNMR